MGKKTQQNFLYIDFSQVQSKIQEQDYIASSPPNGLSLLSLAQLLECSACPNDGSASLIYTDQIRGLINQVVRILLASRVDLHWKAQKYILIILLWALLTRLTTEVLPQYFT